MEADSDALLVLGAPPAKGDKPDAGSMPEDDDEGEDAGDIAATEFADAISSGDPKSIREAFKRMQKVCSGYDEGEESDED